jgi:hypothetical protein
MSFWLGAPVDQQALVQKWDQAATWALRQLGLRLRAGGLDVGEPVLIEIGEPEWWLRVWPIGHRWEEGDRKDVDIMLSFGPIVGDDRDRYWPGLDAVDHDGVFIANAEITEFPIDIHDDAAVEAVLAAVPQTAPYLLEQLRQHYNLARRKKRWRIVRSGPSGLLHASIHTRENDAKGETRHILREILQEARRWASEEGGQDILKKIKSIQKTLAEDKVWPAYGRWMALLEEYPELREKTGFLVVNET